MSKNKTQDTTALDPAKLPKQPDQWAGDCTDLFAQLPGVAAFLKASEPKGSGLPYSRPVYGI